MAFSQSLAGAFALKTGIQRQARFTRRQRNARQHPMCSCWHYGQRRTSRRQNFRDAGLLDPATKGQNGTKSRPGRSRSAASSHKVLTSCKARFLKRDRWPPAQGRRDSGSASINAPSRRYRRCIHHDILLTERIGLQNLVCQRGRRDRRAERLRYCPRATDNLLAGQRRNWYSALMAH